METKTLALTEWTVGAEQSGTLEGIASPYGAVDSYGDTVAVGAYDATTAAFLRDGFLAVDHDWSQRIGFPVEVRSTAAGLYAKFAFHSDPEAQKHRTRTAERMAHGKGVGLSIGYHPDRATKRADGVRVLEAITLYEVSIVGVPAEPLAQATGVKADGAPESKPMASEHRCRLSSPDAYDRFRRVNNAAEHDGRRIDHIFGHAKAGGDWRIQSLAMPTGDWPPDAARSYCATRDGTFEAAKSREADLAAELVALLAEVKEGRRHSTATVAQYRALRDAMSGGLSVLDALIEEAEAALRAREGAAETEPKSAGLPRHRFETNRLLARLRREGTLAW